MQPTKSIDIAEPYKSQDHKHMTAHFLVGTVGAKKINVLPIFEFLGFVMFLKNKN